MRRKEIKCRKEQATMKQNGQTIFRIAVILVFAGFVAASCNKVSDGMIIAVELSGETVGTEDGARLIAFDPENPGKASRVLSKEFHAACSPVLSNNGRYLIFSGKQLQNDPWQIWLRDLRRNSSSRVTDLVEDCTDPAFLPDGKIVFSRSGTIMDTEVSLLFKCNMDGSDLQQLTFHPHSDYASSVLNDGRILYMSSQQYPIKKDPVFMVMRPDGSKSELYHRGVEKSFLVNKGSESENGTVFFISGSQKNLLSGKLMKLYQNRPLHTGMELSDGMEGQFRSVIPSGNTRCIVSYRPSSDVPFALFEFDEKEKKIISKLFAATGNLVDPVLVRLQKRPPILPSAVNTENPTGLLMSQNINHSILKVNGSSLADSVAHRVKIEGVDGPMGEIEVEDDGSFYMKVDADTPFRMLTLNANGEMLRGPSDWIWLRPNERRGCVGCHADPELAPENRAPMAVKHPPVIVSSTPKEISKLEEAQK